MMTLRLKSGQRLLRPEAGRDYDHSRKENYDPRRKDYVPGIARNITTIREGKENLRPEAGGNQVDPKRNSVI